MYVLVGDKGREQIVNLHYMLSKAEVKARPSVLWCYKKELGFTTHRKKRMKELKQKLKAGLVDADNSDPFEMFLSATDIRFCYYAETEKILGNTYGMCVLQDFEALSPNLLARTIETVNGGGIIVLLLRSVQSLQQLYTMAMDVHARFRTESHQDIVCRFNERFLLSLKEMQNCLMLDDTLDVLPWAKQTISITPVTHDAKEAASAAETTKLKSLQESLADTQPVGALVAKAKTVDQAKAILTFVEAISEKTLRSTVTLTAGRGRGKSASLGLSIAAAVSYGYSNIFVTSPSPENLTTLFAFVFKGFDALGYEEHRDYELVQSNNPDFHKAIVRVNVFREAHRQTIQYIQPQDAHKLGQAELVCIDEAAAIPMPLLKALLGPYLVFLSSTISGYEGTGRSLSIKLLQELRKTNAVDGAASMAASGARQLREISLETPIRYAAGDPVEAWLEGLLCLKATIPRPKVSKCPVPSECDLYEVNRDTLFSFNPAAEVFLQRIMALYVASHYKNTPNDLQLLSDAPAHRIFCLLGPVDPAATTLPEILAVVQVALEGEISKASAQAAFRSGQKVAGDMIPWTLAQQFQDSEFPSLSGARIVRIATHPDYQRMGYGKRSIEQITAFYQGDIASIGEGGARAAVPRAKPTRAEMLAPRDNLPSLLNKLSEIVPERLDYLGVGYGLTPELFKFWKGSGFTPVYVAQRRNDLTGEHSAIMLKSLTSSVAVDGWIDAFFFDFSRSFASLLSFAFRGLSATLALKLVSAGGAKTAEPLSAAELGRAMSQFDLKRLHAYASNMIDYHSVIDLVPMVARVWFDGKIPGVTLTAIQRALLVGVGFQRKTVDELAKELEVKTAQLMALFLQTMRKIDKFFRETREAAASLLVPEEKKMTMEPLAESLDEDQVAAAKAAAAAFADEYSEFAIDATDEDFAKALTSGGSVPKSISVKSANQTKRKREHKSEPAKKEESDSKRGGRGDGGRGGGGRGGGGRGGGGRSGGGRGGGGHGRK
jgi:N-acetyltransferase 10